jgi:hypothetical protein
MKYQWGCVWVCVSLLGVPLTIYAQATTPVDQTELIQALLARIDKLEKRVAELEGSPRDTAQVAPDPVAPAESVHQAHPGQIERAELRPTYPSLKIAGFTDFNFRATDQRGSKSGFEEGQFALHFSSALSPKISFLGELSLTARADAGTGTPAATGFNVEVERSILRYDQNDYFKVSLGRYHTPINWWNTAFHHGQWLQTTVSRPEMVQFGGQFIPVHFIGGLIEGTLPAYGLNLNYNLGVGNGRGPVISRGGDFGDVNNNRAWLINLFAKPDRFFGLQVGGSLYRDKITLAGGREFREWITAGHIVWQREDPEVIAEIANVNHREAGHSRSFDSQAFYIQVAYRLPWFERHWKPYYRFEYINVPPGDMVFQDVLDLTGSVVGLRYDIADFAALKLEYRHQQRRELPNINGVFLQNSFTF